jgi:hypothetical protein
LVHPPELSEVQFKGDKRRKEKRKELEIAIKRQRLPM